MTLEYPTSGTVLGFKLKGQGHRVNKCVFHTNVQHNSKTNDRKLFKLDIGNDLVISCKWYGFGLKEQRSRLWLGLGLQLELTLMSVP